MSAFSEVDGKIDNMLDHGLDSLLASLRSDSVRLHVRDGRLHYRAPLGFPTRLQLIAMRKFERELVAFLTRDARLDEGALPRLVPQLRQGDIPQTRVQQAYWLLAKDGRADTLNTDLGYRLRGPLNEDALDAAFAELVARHEILRTRFAAVNGSPVQIVDAPTTGLLRRIDLTREEPSAAERQAYRWCEERTREPIDLVHGPVVSATLLTLGVDDHVLLIRMPHIVTDAWSLALMTAELKSLYTQATARLPASLPPVELQYADFALWQRAVVGTEAYASRLRYWERQLAGAASPRCPLDFPRRAKVPGPLGVIEFEIPSSVGAGLRRLCAAENATMGTGIHAALALLLSRWTGENDFLIYSLSNGRVFPGMEKMLGCLFSGFLLRFRLTGDPTCRELLRLVASEYVAALEHDLAGAWYPLGNGRDGFVSINLIRRDPPYEPAIQGPALWPAEEPLPIKSIARAYCDLNFIIEASADPLQVRIEYDRELFRMETIRWFAEQLAPLIAEMAGDRRVSQLPLGRVRGGPTL